MPATGFPPRRPTHLYLAVPLVAIALAAWGYNWRQQAQHAPVVRHIEVGRHYLAQGQGVAAEQEWQAAVRLEPDNDEAWELLGDFYLAAGNWQAARAALEQVLRLRPDRPRLYARLAVCTAQIEDIPATQRYVDEALKRDPDDVPALDIQTTLLARAHEPQKRLEALRRLVKLQPDNADYLAKLADALTVQAQYDEARPVIERLLKLNPTSGPAYAMRAEAYFNQNPSSGNLTHAAADFQKALTLNPGDQLARLNLGKTYLRLHQPAQAIAQLEPLERSSTADPGYLLELARAYQQTGETAKATATRHRYAAEAQQAHRVEELTSRVFNNPNDFEDNLQLGLRLLHHRNAIGTEKHLQKALALRPGDARARAALQEFERVYNQHLQSALAALQRGHYAEVGPHLSRAMQLRPHDPRTMRAVQQFMAHSSVAQPAPAAKRAAP